MPPPETRERAQPAGIQRAKRPGAAARPAAAAPLQPARPRAPPAPRSKRLTRWRPVVILDAALPEAGSGWDDIARLKDVWFCQARVCMAKGLAKLVCMAEGGTGHAQRARGTGGGGRGFPQAQPNACTHASTHHTCSRACATQPPKRTPRNPPPQPAPPPPRQGSAHSSSDLLRVNAEAAAAGILLPAFDCVAQEEDDAALQAAAMSDGAVIEAWQQLKTVNPGMQARFGGAGGARAGRRGEACLWARGRGRARA